MALIAQTLRNAFVDGRAFQRIAIGALGLDHHKRDTVNEANDIRPTCLHTAAAQHTKLFGEDKAVIGRVMPVDQCHRRVGFFAIHELSYRDAIQQVVVQPLVGSLKPFIERRATYFANQIVDGLGRERVFTPTKQEATFA